MTADEHPPVRIAIPAATVVLFRQPADDAAPPELLLLERASQMAFAGGAMVFPGGRVDPADRVLAARLGTDLDLDDAAARIAAIRETIEEAGIAIGITPHPTPAVLAQAREALARGETLGAVAAEHRWTLAIDQLLPFARWQPEIGIKRVFDTRFYAVAVPPGTAADPDGGESVDAVWLTATQALEKAAAGEMRMLFPTRRNLDRIAALGSFAAFAADARARAVPLITPQVERRDGVDWLCIPEGLGYPVTMEPAHTALRT